MSDGNTILNFPCEFHLKVIGQSGTEFESAVTSILQRHLHTLAQDAVRRQYSAQQRYQSLTVTFTALSREHVDKLYRDLHACAQVKMVL